MRRAVLIILFVAAAGCFHYNASPFVHGAKNAPSRGGSTWTPRTETASTATAANFGGSSGNSGGYVNVGGPAGGGAPAATATGFGGDTTMTTPAPAGTTSAATASR